MLVMRFFSHRLSDVENIMMMLATGQKPRPFPNLLRGALYVRNHQGWVWCGEQNVLREGEGQEVRVLLKTGRYVLLEELRDGKASMAIPIGVQLPFIIPLLPYTLDPHAAEGFDAGKDHAVIITPRGRGIYHVRFHAARWPRRTGEYAHLGRMATHLQLARAIWQTFAPPDGLKPFIASRSALPPAARFTPEQWGHPIRIGEAILDRRGLNTVLYDNGGSGVVWTADQLLAFARILEAIRGTKYWRPKWIR
jgi:hypothetical protein